MRHKDIDTVFLAKGIGISLVVIGHYAPESSPEYWIHMRNIIYSFHMPLFFLLAGYLYGFSPPEPSNYIDFLRKKAERLLVPFVAIAALFFSVKSCAGLFFKLQSPVTLDSLISIFIYPVNSYLTLLWFIYTLFIIFALFPIICILVRNNILLLFATLLAFYFIEWTQYFCLAHVFQNLPIFAIGFMLGNRNIDIDDIAAKYALIILIVSITTFTIVYLQGFLTMESRILKLIARLVLAISGSLTCISICILAHSFGANRAIYLRYIGVYSMSIYLLHTLFSGIVRISFYQVLRVPDSEFVYGAIAGITTGILIPLILEKYFLRKYKFTKRVFLGLG